MIAALILEPFELWWAARCEPELRGVPLVAVREERVRHATSQARRDGITPGMALSGARLRSEELRVCQPSEAELQAGWETVLRELQGLTPFLAAPQRGRVLLGISQAEAREVAEAYEGRAGIAAGAEIAELAALSARSGRCQVVPPGCEGLFLEKLPLRFLKLVGLSDDSLRRLGWLGLATAGDLAEWKRGQSQAFLGDEARLLAPYLYGPRRDRLPLLRPPRAVRRTLAFEEPVYEPGPLTAALADLAQALEAALEGRSSRRLTLIAQVGGGVELRATRFAKKPLRVARDIALLAGFALDDSGAAPVGIETLALELPEPVRESSQSGLWLARERREAAWEQLLERFPEATVEVEWLDPYAESADLMWRWRHPAGEGQGAERREPVEAGTGAQARTWADSRRGEVNREASATTRSGDGERRKAEQGSLVFG